ncbi:MAG: type I-E CRISPR-associated endoribonuclease Cas2e [Planctomycetia bacterium]|nr:type I-E CRISPR-associated endoribonuclease Cas2e [Planctomycetia bacterium]
MIVIVANSLPPAVRGKLKLWFLEPKPNVFVSGIKDSLADRVVEKVMKYCPLDSGILVFQTTQKAPGYRILAHGMPAKTLEMISGFQLILEKWDSPEPIPF